MDQLIRELIAAQNEASREIVNSIKDMRANIAKQAIPFFTGKLDGMSAYDWLEVGEQVARSEGWTSEETAARLQERLIPPASMANTALTAQTRGDLALWRVAFLKEFNDESTNAQLYTTLDNLKQMQDERVRDFENRLNILYQRVHGVGPATSNEENMKKIRNKQKTRIFLKGLSPTIYNLVWNRINPEAADEWDDVVKAAKSVEATIFNRRITEENSNHIVEKIQELKKENATMMADFTNKMMEQLEKIATQSNH